MVTITKILCECVGCKSRREVLPGEVEIGDQPMCNECGMPMIVVCGLQAEFEDDD